MKKLRNYCLILGTVLATFLASCTDRIDESNMNTFTGETAYSYMEASDSLSDFAYIATKVKMSAKSKSSVAELLSARGNYTIFAPTNGAIRRYLDSLYLTTNYDVTQIPDSTAEYIVFNSIVNNGNDEKAYLSADFIEGTLPRTNMEDRYIQVKYTNNEDGTLRTIINQRSAILAPDIEVSNGVIHAIDRVIDLSGASLGDLIKATPNLQIFASLLSLTHLDDSITIYRDEAYEEYHIPEGTLDRGNGVGVGVMGPSPEHRYYGFTAFVETDSVLIKKWKLPAAQYADDGTIVNLTELVAATIAKCQEVYPDALDADFTSENNAVHQFVAYHLLPERLTWNRIVIHHNEMGYGYRQKENLTIECYEYYEAIGKPRRLMKIVEGNSSNGKRINRHCVYDNSLLGDYHVISCDRPGIKIRATNGGYSNNALNGFYYPIDEVLVYDEDVPNVVLNERLRFDFTAICPDLMSNNLRQIENNNWYYIPPGYLSTFHMDVNTAWRYVPYYSESQYNWQADEINIVGQYDFTFRLPPVPYEGTWEFRMCSPQIAHFGMFQVYLGTDMKNLPAVGLPLDFRLKSSNPSIGWSLGRQSDVDAQREIDKRMRIHGYMKNNMHNGSPNGGAPVVTPMRYQDGDYIRMRKIVWSGNMKPEETYYVRIKSVLENTTTCCMLDYFELCPKSVFNGVDPEDPW